MEFKRLSSGENEAIVFDEKKILKVSNYWTEDRIKNATPMNVKLKAEFPIEKRDNNLGGEVISVNVRNAPYKAGGKIVFTYSGKDYMGSAEFCGEKNLILTAAHCLRDMETGEWADNVSFILGYEPDYSFGIYPISTLALKTMWYKEKKYRWDYGFGVIAKKSQGSFSLDYDLNINTGEATAFGYPSNYYAGLKMVSVTERIEDNPYEAGTLKMEGNDMGGGCSGGAWVKKGTNTAISLNSFSYEGIDDVEYGPKFDEKFENLVQYAKTL